MYVFLEPLRCVCFDVQTMALHLPEAISVICAIRSVWGSLFWNVRLRLRRLRCEITDCHVASISSCSGCMGTRAARTIVRCAFQCCNDCRRASKIFRGAVLPTFADGFDDLRAVTALVCQAAKRTVEVLSCAPSGPKCTAKTSGSKPRRHGLNPTHPNQNARRGLSPAGILIFQRATVRFCASRAA